MALVVDDPYELKNLVAAFDRVRTPMQIASQLGLAGHALVAPALRNLQYTRGNDAAWKKAHSSLRKAVTAAIYLTAGEVQYKLKTAAGLQHKRLRDAEDKAGLALVDGGEESAKGMQRHDAGFIQASFPGTAFTMVLAA